MGRSGPLVGPARPKAALIILWTSSPAHGVSSNGSASSFPCGGCTWRGASTPTRPTAGTSSATMTPTKRRTTRTDLISSWCRTARGAPFPNPATSSRWADPKPSLSVTRRSSQRTPSTRRAMAASRSFRRTAAQVTTDGSPTRSRAGPSETTSRAGCTTRRGPFSGHSSGSSGRPTSKPVSPRPATRSVCSPAARARSWWPAPQEPKTPTAGPSMATFPETAIFSSDKPPPPLGSSPPRERHRSHLRPPPREHLCLPT